jgi:5-methyltetrahydropteroyltriglutamate--homocysteine methyltransferase
VSEHGRHPFAPKTSFDGGNLDCGNGLLLLIRQHIDPLAQGELLEIRSLESSVDEDLPAWCRLTGNELVSTFRDGQLRSFLVSRGRFDRARAGSGASPALRAPDATRGARAPAPVLQPIVPVTIPAELPRPAPAAPIAPLSVMGIGSWPRPRWLLQALHERLEGRLDAARFDETASDAVRLAVDAQIRAGVDVVTDGEQRRDNYASFVGGRLDNCQLVPITDLLPYVDDPEKFRAELDALDVPAEKVRHPAVFGPLGRSRDLAVHELAFTSALTSRPVKVALPGPYLLTRSMWMECISDRAYENREALAEDVVRVLREEIHYLLAAGAALVQLDEPVLTEVVFGRPSSQRSFMCGALGEKLAPREELAFARDLVDRVVEGLPRERLALHVCRGNWSPDERVALSGDYEPLLPLLTEVNVGTLFLELATPRAGDVAVLSALPKRLRVGVGVVNQKSPVVEPDEQVLARARRAVDVLGAERVLLTPDCGFATFADNPLAAADVAAKKLAAIARVATILRG